MDIFEKGTRLAVRFYSPQGLLSIEDLWNLPLTASATKASLDNIAKALHVTLQKDDVESFVLKSPAKKDVITKLQFDIVKHIIDVRLAEQEKAELLKANRDKKAKLIEILEKKEDEALVSKTPEEIRAMINEL